jgi:hypothetical protein
MSTIMGMELQQMGYKKISNNSLSTPKTKHPFYISKKCDRNII